MKKWKKQMLAVGAAGAAVVLVLWSVLVGPGSIEISSENLGLFVLPDRIVERTEDVILAEYFQGMPVAFNVRIVDIAAKRSRENVEPVKVPGKWKEHVHFSIANGMKESAGVRVCVARGEEIGRRQNSEVLLGRDDLRGTWMIRAEDTSHLAEGDYVFKARFGSATARAVTVRIRKPSSQEDLMAVEVRKALDHYLWGEYKKAAEKAKEAMAEGGRLVRDGSAHVILIAARSYEALGDPGGALELYEEYKRIYVPASAREDLFLVNLKIEELRKKRNKR